MEKLGTLRKSLPALLVLASLTAGCGEHHMLSEPLASIAQSGLINDPRQVSRLEKAMTDGDIANLLDLDVKAKLPTNLAIVKLASDCAGYQPRLERISGEELEEWEKIVSAQPHIHGVLPVSNLSFDGKLDAPDISLRSLRVAAARLHCELLLVYMQGDSQVENFNDAAILYWTLIGLWISPGTTLEHKTVMQAIIVDCRTGMILGTATGDSHRKRICPAMFADIDKAKLSKLAPAEALGKLRSSVKPLLHAVVSRAVASAR